MQLPDESPQYEAGAAEQFGVSATIEI